MEGRDKRLGGFVDSELLRVDLLSSSKKGAGVGKYTEAP
jgi:hypothetical protein